MAIKGGYSDYVDDIATGARAASEQDPFYNQWAQDTGNAPQQGQEQPQDQSGLSTSYQPAQAPSQASQQESQTPSSTPPPAQTSSQETAPPTNQLRYADPDQSTGTFYEQLFGTKDRLDKAGKALQEGQKSFYELAGPSRSFDAIGGQDTLRTAAEQGTRLDEAASLVGAQYKGPQNLAQENTDVVDTNLAQLQGVKPMLGSSIGVEDALVGLHPTMTRGERRMESEAVQKDPGFAAAAAEEQAKIDSLAKEYAAAQEKATAFAGQRQAEESDIANQSKGVLQGLEGDWRQQITDKAAQEQVLLDAANAAFAKFQETGDKTALEGIDPKYMGFQVSDLNSQTDALAREAEAKKAEIMAEYSDLADIPLLQLAVSKHGHETLKLPAKWFDENAKQLPKKERDKLMARLKERQLALEGAGFASRKGKVGAGKTTTVSSVDPSMEPGDDATKKELKKYQAAVKNNRAGAYSEVDPLYFQGTSGVGAWKPLDARDYVLGWEGGAGKPPTPENMSTEEQRTVINRINQLLGEADNLQAADPYKASQIQADVEGFFKDEAAEMARRRGSLTEAQQSWKKIVERYHDKLEELKHSGAFYTAGHGDIGGMGKAGFGTMGGVGSHDPNRVKAPLQGRRTPPPGKRA